MSSLSLQPDHESACSIHRLYNAGCDSLQLQWPSRPPATVGAWQFAHVPFTVLDHNPELYHSPVQHQLQSHDNCRAITGPRRFA